MVVGTVALLLIALVIAGALTAGRGRPKGTGAALPRSSAAADDLGRLAAWEAAGLVTAAQAQAIRLHELAAAPPPPPPVPSGAPDRRIPAVAEALGYIGGVLAAAGLALLLARSWGDLGTVGRLAMGGAGAAALTAAGAAVRQRPRDDASARLRGFLWLLASGATAVFAAVAAADAAGIDRNATLVAFTAGAVAVHAGALWRGRSAPAQQATCLAAGLVTVAAVAGESGRGDVIGASLLIAAAAVAAAGLDRRTTIPVLTTLVGAMGMAGTQFFFADQWGGPGLVTAVGVTLTLLAVGLLRRGPAEAPRLPAERIAVAAVGLASIPLSVPATLGWFARDAGVVTGLVVAVAGAVAVALAAHDRVHAAHVVEAAGGVTVVGGLALVGVQSVGLATVAGLLGAVGLVAAGTLPERSILSIVGALGLLINVPWAIGWFFPGEGRMPALVTVTGALIVGVAVLLSHQSGRLRRELGGHRNHGAGAG